LAQAILDACAKEKSPLILQISKGARKYANIRYLKAIIDAGVAEYPDLPICVHCDHGDTVDLIQQCVNDGYTSVMIDGSHYDYDKNVKLTKDATDLAHANGVVVEAELGMLGGIEEDVVGLDAEEYEKNVEKFLTDPIQAADFWKKTGIDSLAVAIGTSHGAYKFTRKPTGEVLAMDRIEEIHRRLPNCHLVMHGSSSVPQELQDVINKYGGKLKQTWGVPVEEIQRGIKNGVRKVNVDTDNRLAITGAIRKVFAESPEKFDPRDYLKPARDAMKRVCVARMTAFGQAGQARKIKPVSCEKFASFYAMV
jgi:fructose-bisphosphate aldolase class II